MPEDLRDRRPSLHRHVRRALATAVVIAVLATPIGVWTMRRLLDAREHLVDAVDPATLASQELLSALVDQETAVRAFVLTTDVQFLDPYQPGRAAAAEAGRRLQALVGTTGAGPEVVAALAAAARWQDRYAEPTVADVMAGSTAGRSDAALTVGRELFEDIRATVAALQQRLERERTVARDRLDAATTQLVAVLLAVAALLVVIVAALFLLIRRRVEDPLDDLLADARSVAGGAYDRPVRPSGLAELHELGEAMEAMRSRIVTELAASRSAQEELAQQARDLARSNAELEQFAYVASHDLQEPLRKVTAFCQLLQDRYGGQLDDRADQYIDFAVDGAKRMQVLINDLLTFSRVGRERIEAEAVPAASLVEGALANLATMVEQWGAEVTCDDLPAVRVVPALGVAVLQNLIGNAVKFHRPDVAPRVRVSGRPADGFVELTVADNGIGIEPAYAERVFVIFQRLHPKEAYPGTGIGLALCRKIIEQHGGRIWIDADAGDGTGTVVRFTLPAADERGDTP